MVEVTKSEFEWELIVAWTNSINESQQTNRWDVLWILFDETSHTPTV